jgi:hypothetical protein
MPDDLESLDGPPGEFEIWFERYMALKDARRDHPYVGDIIRVLMPYANGLRRSMVLHELERQRKADGLPIPPTFEAAVQSSYNQHSIDSSVFRKRHAPDTEGIFYSPEGKGSGRWAVNRARALPWLKNKFGDEQA